MIIRNFTFCILAFTTFLMSGCATKTSSNIINQDLYQASDYYVVVNNPKSNMKGVDSEIVSALGNYGISAKILNEQEAKNSHAPVIVTYEDWYKWDLVQYLWSLDIRFNDTEEVYIRIPRTATDTKKPAKFLNCHLYPVSTCWQFKLIA